MRVNITSFILFNYNEEAFQTEIVISNMKVDMESNTSGQNFKICLGRLEVNDLTRFPFTKKPFEIDNLLNTERH